MKMIAYHATKKKLQKKEQCKLRIIREILRSTPDFLSTINNKQIDCFHFPYSYDKWGPDDKLTYTLPENANMQIIAVRDIETAIFFLTCSEYKFDIILLDFLLAREQGKVQYGTTLFNHIDPVLHTTSTSPDERKTKKLLSKAGLSDRFWIYPITAFKEAFSNTLCGEDIPLINHRWYIYEAINPIVTPVKFANGLNRFVTLMTNQCKYSEPKLLEFLNNTYELLNAKAHDLKNNFVPIMGSEYTRLVQLYGYRLNIMRDKDVSLFSKYIWENFYKDSKNIEAIRLNAALMKFCYVAAHCTGDHIEVDKIKEILNTDLKNILQHLGHINLYNKFQDMLDEYCKKL
ncbi:MAG: hypothetical protein LUH04_11985 [Clostridium sp.]|nr:hypothetical protein [Clostridium sp.]